MKKRHKKTSKTRKKRKTKAKSRVSNAKKLSPKAVAAGNAPAWRHINRLQLAELLGVHPDTVSDYSRSGMPVIKRGGHGVESVYDAVECLAWWRMQQGHDAKEMAQTRAYEAQAALNELKLKIQTGKLMPSEDVVRHGQDYTKSWVAKLRALPRQMVNAGIVTPVQEAAVAELIRTVLEEISKWKTIAT